MNTNEEIAQEAWRKISHEQGHPQQTEANCINHILSAITKATKGLYYCDGNGYHEIKHRTASRAAPASAEQPFQKVLRLFRSDLRELAERLEWWARAGTGSKDHSRDCEDASQIIHAISESQPQKERTQ